MEINLNNIPIELMEVINNSLVNELSGATLLKNGKAIGTVKSLHKFNGFYRLYLTGYSTGSGEYRFNNNDNNLIISFY